MSANNTRASKRAKRARYNSRTHSRGVAEVNVPDAENSSKRTSNPNRKALARLDAKRAEKRSRKSKPAKPARLKPECRIRLANGRELEIGNASNAGDVEFAWFQVGKKFVITPHSDWHSGQSAGFAKLCDGGIVVVTEAAEVRKAVGSLKRFRRMPIVTRPGWFEDGFALMNGRILVPESSPRPLAAFQKIDGMLGQAGTLEGWKEKVAAPLAGHMLPSFCMMIMFAPALLALIDRGDNFGFELVGAPGCGKTTLQQIVASAAGPAIGPNETRYWRTLNATNNAIETLLPIYNYMPLVLDEAGLMPGSDKSDSRAANIRDLSFRMSSGYGKHRHGEKLPEKSSLVYLISTNLSTSSLVESTYAAESGAIVDRLMTLPLLADRPFKFFDHLPPSFATTKMLVDSLLQGVGEHYGHAVPAFLQFLVDQRHKSPERLAATIKRDMAELIDAAGTNGNDGSQVRVVEAMALVYSAGRFARRAGVLPPSFPCKKATLAALELHRAWPPSCRVRRPREGGACQFWHDRPADRGAQHLGRGAAARNGSVPLHGQARESRARYPRRADRAGLSRLEGHRRRR